MIGDKFLVRGYDNGEYFQIRDDYQPTLFVSSNKETQFIINQTINGIRRPDEIFIVNHFLVALIILKYVPSN